MSKNQTSKNTRLIFIAISFNIGTLALIYLTGDFSNLFPAFSLWITGILAGINIGEMIQKNHQ
jgi:hypothetical protein